SMTGAIRSEARKQIETTFYVGKTQKMTLERFINVHKSAHMDLEEHGSSMPRDQQVEELVKHIQDPRLTSICDHIVANVYCVGAPTGMGVSPSL
ncbi:MAG: hypothetical protein ACRDL7_12270, partial [Gaiellaceae bacterium]